MNAETTELIVALTRLADATEDLEYASAIDLTVVAIGNRWQEWEALLAGQRSIG